MNLTNFNSGIGKPPLATFGDLHNYNCLRYVRSESKGIIQTFLYRKENSLLHLSRYLLLLVTIPFLNSNFLNSAKQSSIIFGRIEPIVQRSLTVENLTLNLVLDDNEMQPLSVGDDLFSWFSFTIFVSIEYL